MIERRSTEDIQHQIENLQALQTTHRNRLNVLQRQQATFGVETPPHIQTEIVTIDSEMTRINAQIMTLEQERWNITLDPESLVPQSIVPATIAERLIALQKDIVNLGYQLRREVAALHKAHNDYRDDDRDWKETERKERIEGQQSYYRWLVLIAAFFILMSFVVIAIAAYAVAHFGGGL